MKLARRVFPHPYLSALLLLVWCLLNNSFSLNTLVFGFILSIVIQYCIDIVIEVKFCARCNNIFNFREKIIHAKILRFCNFFEV